MTWDLDKAVQHLVHHSFEHSQGKCARYTREAIEAGGVQLARHDSAKDYGTSLVQVGFRVVGDSIEGPFLKGDVAIVRPIPGHPHGHMAMYSGTRWISDFKQNPYFSGPYPGPGYRKLKPGYKIYRYGTLVDSPAPSDMMFS